MIWTDLRYWQWRRHNPQADFGAFYVATVVDRLDAGKAHRTLGMRQWSLQSDRNMPHWTADSFKGRGADQANLLQELGLQPHFRCVDYGCGSLRLGQHLMRLLPRAHYCGVDVTDRFFRDGLNFIDPALLEEKQPHLGIIDEAELSHLAQDPPDFLFSYAVLKHVPPGELDRYFANMTRLIGPRTRAIVFFMEGPRQQRISTMSWAYDGDVLAAMVRGLYPDLAIDIRRLTHGQEAERPELGHSILQLLGRELREGTRGQ